MVEVEFINTCPCCDVHVQTIKEVAVPYGDQVKVKIYYVGKDFDYLKKYGMLTKGTMIINGQKKYDNLTRKVIEQAVQEAVRGCTG